MLEKNQTSENVQMDGMGVGERVIFIRAVTVFSTSLLNDLVILVSL